MSKSDKPSDIDEIILKSHKRGVENAIDTASRTNTRLIIQENGKVIAVRPKYKYVRVPVKSSKKTNTDGE